MAAISTTRAELSRRIAAQQDRTLSGVLAQAPEPNWKALARDADPRDDGSRARVIAAIVDHQRSEEFRAAAVAVQAHGLLIADWALARDGATLLPPSARFAGDVIPITPEMIVDYWRRKIPLTPERASAILTALRTLSAEAIASKWAAAMTDHVIRLFARALAEGMTLSKFREALRDVAPSVSSAHAETLFRTGMTRAYGAERIAGIRRNGLRTPFIQYLAIMDDRVRITHGAMNGYVAASTDSIWLTWQIPNGYNERCDLSPVSYLEAIRRGWAAYGPGGRGLVFPLGPRPLGDPPSIVFDAAGKAHAVTPDEGFGAGEKGIRFPGIEFPEAA